MKLFESENDFVQTIEHFLGLNKSHLTIEIYGILISLDFLAKKKTILS